MAVVLRASTDEMSPSAADSASAVPSLPFRVFDSRPERAEPSSTKARRKPAESVAPRAREALSFTPSRRAKHCQRLGAEPV